MSIVLRNGGLKMNLFEIHFGVILKNHGNLEDLVL